MRDTTSWKPEILSSQTVEGDSRISSLMKSAETVLVDTREAMLSELAAIEHPNLYFSGKLDSAVFSMKKFWAEEKIPEVWAWYPWKKTLVSILPEEEFVRIRTSRNKHLITEEEQKKFRETVIGIAGLSVGYSIALALVLEGGGKHLRLADNDTLDLSNLNRLPYAIDEIGLKKSTIVARRLYELDPYLDLDITLCPEGLSMENTSLFTKDLGMIVDEVDNLGIKLTLREEAKRMKIPLLMATDNEETGMVDIERYDDDKHVLPFLGRLPDMSARDLSALSKRESGKLIAQYVGNDYTSERMRESLRSIGSTLVSWPQIGGTALLNGAAMAYAIREIIKDSTQLPTGRYVISLPHLFRVHI